MAFKPITERDLLSSKQTDAPPFLSVNSGSGGYLGGNLFQRMGEPRFVEIEYDAEAVCLRVRKNSSGIVVKNKGFKLPESVKKDMVVPRAYYSIATRYDVEMGEDGWWVTTDILLQCKPKKTSLVHHEFFTELEVNGKKLPALCMLMHENDTYSQVVETLVGAYSRRPYSNVDESVLREVILKAAQDLDNMPMSDRSGLRAVTASKSPGIVLRFHATIYQRVEGNFPVYTKGKL
jgi:hypothetical protein